MENVSGNNVMFQDAYRKLIVDHVGNTYAIHYENFTTRGSKDIIINGRMLKYYVNDKLEKQFYLTQREYESIIKLIDNIDNRVVFSVLLTKIRKMHKKATEYIDEVIDQIMREVNDIYGVPPMYRRAIKDYLRRQALDYLHKLELSEK